MLLSGQRGGTDPRPPQVWPSGSASAKPRRPAATVSLVPPILEFLSLRTFSSVWYWIAVATIWAFVSHRPMGIPYDMVSRGAADWSARMELDTVAKALARRILRGLETGGAFLVGLLSTLLSAVGLLAILYGLELAQGLLLLALPLILVGWFTTRTARAIASGGDAARHLRRLRLTTNAVAVVALFATSVWGMYVNFAVSVL